jgi:hypothetical protein
MHFFHEMNASGSLMYCIVLYCIVLYCIVIVGKTTSLMNKTFFLSEK